MELQEYITFQEEVTDQAPNGEITKTWQNIASVPSMWCKAIPLKSDENMVADTESFTQKFRFIVRHRTDLKNKYRISWDGKLWDIYSVLPYMKGGRNNYIAIEAKYTEGKY